jgi:hypothetical protein
MWAEESLASVWRSASARHLQTEACLEAGLVGALEIPEVLRRLADHLNWSLPEGQPIISRQDVVRTGRTDVTLTWSDGRRAKRPYQLVLELKVGDPPDDAQIRKYLRDGKDVAAVARFVRPISIPDIDGHRMLGVVPWRRIRNLSWDGAPLPLVQLHHLLDATGAAVPNITLPGLTGFMSSWSAWEIFHEWSVQAASAVAEDFGKANYRWVSKKGKKGRRSFDSHHERYVARLWSPPARADWLYVFMGLFVGREGDPVLVEGVPDLFFALQVDPTKAMGRRLQQDGNLKAAVDRWTSRDDLVRREFWPGEWEVLRARASAVDLVKTTEQETKFAEWMRVRAQEWIDDEILDCIQKADVATRGAVGKAPAEE